MGRKFAYFFTSYPPTINTYYGSRGKRRFINKRGKEYREEILALWNKGDKIPIDGRIIIGITLYPPDNRKRDWDNIVKPLQDALMHAGVFEDDSQVEVGMVRKMGKIKGGGAQVFILQADDYNRGMFDELFNDMVIDLGWSKNDTSNSTFTNEVQTDEQ